MSPAARVPPRVSAAYPTGEVPIEDIASAPDNDAYRVEYERWLAAGQPPGSLRNPTLEEMARTFEHGEAQLRAQRRADDLPLFFGGDPRRPDFIQTPTNPDPSRYYRVVDSEEDAHLALEEGELPLVLPRSVQSMPIAGALALINDVQQRMYEHPGAPFRNAVEPLRRGMPARGAESPIQPTIVPRYNVETEAGGVPAARRDDDELLRQLRAPRPGASIAPRRRGLARRRRGCPIAARRGRTRPAPVNRQRIRQRDVGAGRADGVRRAEPADPAHPRVADDPRRRARAHHGGRLMAGGISRIVTLVGKVYGEQKGR